MKAFGNVMVKAVVNTHQTNHSVPKHVAHSLSVCTIGPMTNITLTTKTGWRIHITPYPDSHVAVQLKDMLNRLVADTYATITPEEAHKLALLLDRAATEVEQ